MIVIGIDPGTATTGYGLIFENERADLEIIEYGVILTEKNLPLEERLLILNEKLEEIITLHRPDESAVERLFYQKNVTNALSIGHARGVIIFTFAKKKIPVYEYAPLEIKQAVVGYGAAEKKQVQSMVKAILDLQEIPKPDDAADALAVAICHQHSRRIKCL